jgi:hypothetical protein
MITFDEVCQAYVNAVLRAERAEIRVKELEARLSEVTKPAPKEVPGGDTNSK